MATNSNAAEIPFPGLRSYEPEEAHLFFGRESQVDELLDRLSSTRFVAVIGNSGCGKSSLVKAGLIPGVQGGFMPGATANWRITTFRPAGRPLASLAGALARLEGIRQTDDDGTVRASRILADLKSGALGLIEAVRQFKHDGDNLLLIVDQFEELFRFPQIDEDNLDASTAARFAAHNDALAFVKLLLAATSQQDVPIYVVITMRSDFLGPCAEFPGLAEAINRGAYLVPKLGREQLKEAIEGPIRVGGREISDRLSNKILNEIQDLNDQLPILQHALMRMWIRAQHDTDKRIDIADFEAIGSLEHAIEQHMEEIFRELSTEERTIAEVLFRNLAEETEGGNTVRTPRTFGELCTIVKAPSEMTQSVIDRFRIQGRSFLLPLKTKGQPDLCSEDVIDIAHESLIRQWPRLLQWTAEDAQDNRTEKRLTETAKEWDENGRDPSLLDRGSKLALDEEWTHRHRERANDQVRGFVRASRLTERRRRLLALASVGLIAVFGISTAVVMFLFYSSERVNFAEQKINLENQLDELRDAVNELNKRREELANENNRMDVDLEAKEKDLKQKQDDIQNRINHLENIQSEFEALTVLNAQLTREASERTTKAQAEELRASAVERGNYALLTLDFEFADRRFASAAESQADDLRLGEAQAAFWALYRQSPPPIRVFQNLPDVPSALALSKNGNVALVGDSKGGLHLWTPTSSRFNKLEQSFDAEVRLLHPLESDDYLVGLRDGRLVSFSVNDSVVTSKGRFPGQFPPIVQVFDNGKQVLTRNDEGSFSIYEIPEGNLEDKFEIPIMDTQIHGDSATPIAIAAHGDDRFVIASSAIDSDQWNVKIWSYETSSMPRVSQRPAFSFNSETAIRALALSPDASVLFIGLEGKRLQSLTLDAGDSGNDATLESGQNRMQQESGGREAVEIQSTYVECQHENNALIATTNAAQVYSSHASGRIVLWDFAQKPVARVTTFADRHDDDAGIRLFAATGDGDTVLSVDDSNRIRIWNRDNEALFLDTPIAHEGGLYGVSLSPDGRLVTSCGEDGVTRIWDSVSGFQLRELSDANGQVQQAVFSPDGKYLAAASWDQEVKVYDLYSIDDELKSNARWKLQGHRALVRGVSFLSDNQRLVSTDNDGRILYWKLDVSRNNLSPLHEATVSENVWSVDASQLPGAEAVLTAGDDRTVRLWNDQLSEMTTFPLIHSDVARSVRFAHTQNRSQYALSASYDSRIYILDTGDMRDVSRLEGHTSRVYEAVFSGDDEYALSGSLDNTLNLWRLSGTDDGEFRFDEIVRPLRSFREHAGSIRAVAFSPNPDEYIAASGGSDGTLIRWDFDWPDAYLKQKDEIESQIATAETEGNSARICADWYFFHGAWALAVDAYSQIDESSQDIESRIRSGQAYLALARRVGSESLATDNQFLANAYDQFKAAQVLLQNDPESENNSQLQQYVNFILASLPDP
jgi:WD40 repeat protein/energy-coupling factor transporter ATP-binding protein EcfA2